MTLAPIGELFHMRRRPETVLEVNRALESPAATVGDYVFTENLRHQFTRIFDRVERGRGQGYWVRAQYGGGKTHFLATVAALLRGGDDVWEAAHDDEVRDWHRRLAGTRLFPVVFSLRGKAAVDRSVPLSLYDVFEAEITEAARRELGIELRLSTADEVQTWWEQTDDGIRGAIDSWVQSKLNRRASEMKSDREAFKDAVLEATAAMKIRIPLGVKTEERLHAAFRQIVNDATGYAGILVIIDEFAFWQGQRPENTREGYEDEEFLETIGATLPQARGLQYTVIVASQAEPPVKLKDAQRYLQFDLAPGDAAAELFEYQQVVSHRVRDLDPSREPEIDEYHQDTQARYSFGTGLTRDAFRVMFPVEPTTYRILQRITSSLASERVGINVLWEVLGDPQAQEPRVRDELRRRSRLVGAPLLLASPSLRLELTEPRHAERWAFLEAAREALAHCDLEADERDLARDVLEALFLWNVAQSAVNAPMPLEELTAAVLAEQGFFNSPREAVESVLAAMRGLEQVAFDQRTGTAEFVARGQTGRPAQQIFTEFRARPLQNAEQRWREYLLDSRLGHDGLASLFAGKTPGAAEKAAVTWGQVEHEGRIVYADSWRGELGASLNPQDGFFRVVFLLNAQHELRPEAVQHERVVVCVPRDLTDSERNALKEVVALAQMEQEYAGRDDDEALRVRNFVQQQRPEKAAELIRRQQEHYRNGQIITKAGLSIEPRDVFQAPQPQDRLNAIVRPMLEAAFRERPFGAFRGAAPFAGNVAQWVAEAILVGDPTARKREAASSFGPGLGLSDNTEPTKLTGENAPALRLIRHWLEEAEAQGSGIAVWQIQERLGERGVPPRMATLFLLAFVRRTAEHAELLLKQGSRVILQGRPDSPPRLTSADIPHLNITPAVMDGGVFDQLVRSRSVSFGDAIGWLRALDDDLRPANTPEEVSDRSARVREKAAELAGTAGPARAALRDLAALLGTVPPVDTDEALSAAEALRDAPDFAAVYERARQHYDSEAAFRQGMERARAAEQLALNAGPIRAAIVYLQQLAGRLESKPELEVERQAQLAQLRLDVLLTPDGWERLQPGVTRFKERYSTQYRMFHRDTTDELRRLREEHSEAGRRLTALERLSVVPALRAGSMVTLRNRWQAMAGDLRPCSKGVDVSVDASPVCQECGMPFGFQPPRAELDALGREIDESLERSVRGFKTAAVQRAMEEYAERGDGLARAMSEAITVGGDQIVTFFADTDAPEPLLRALFEDVRLARVNVAGALRQQYPTVTEANLDAVVTAFRGLLVQDHT